MAKALFTPYCEEPDEEQEQYKAERRVDLFDGCLPGISI